MHDKAQKGGPDPWLKALGTPFQTLRLTCHGSRSLAIKGLCFKGPRILTPAPLVMVESMILASLSFSAMVSTVMISGGTLMSLWQ